MTMSSIINYPTVSLENVDPQVRRLLLLDLTNAFEGAIADYKANPKGFKLDTKQLSAIVQRRTKMKAIFLYQKDDPIPNMYVQPPSIDINSPVINQWRRYYINNKDGLAAVNFKGMNPTITVDYTTGEVGGLATEIPFDIYLTRGIFERSVKPFTASELAAMAIHELGHVVTLFATLGQVAQSAQIITEYVRCATNTPVREDRIKLVAEMMKETGVQVSDKDGLVDAQNVSTMTAILYSDVIEGSRSQYGSTLYDLRNWESLSDQYVARQGGAVDLATALDKMLRQHDPEAYRGTLAFIAMETVKFIGLLAAIAVSAVTGSVLIMIGIGLALSYSPFIREYDKPKERLTRLRNDLVAQLKSPRTPKQYADQLVADIAAMDNLMKSMNNKETLFEHFWLVISPWTRRQRKITKEIQEMEALVNNDLFVHAHNLKNLA